MRCSGQEIIARLGQFALGGADLEQVLAEAARVLRAGGCDVAALIERIGDRGHEFVVRAACGEGRSVGRQEQGLYRRTRNGPRCSIPPPAR